MRSDPWKFESTWKSEYWFDQNLATFLASNGALYISTKVIDHPTTYFKLNGATVELWDSGTMFNSWGVLITSAPGALEGVPMGLLLGITYPA